MRFIKNKNLLNMKTPRLLNVLKVARKAYFSYGFCESCMDFACGYNDIDKVQFKKLESYYEKIKEILKDREHVSTNIKRRHG